MRVISYTFVVLLALFALSACDTWRLLTDEAEGLSCETDQACPQGFFCDQESCQKILDAGPADHAHSDRPDAADNDRASSTDADLTTDTAFADADPTDSEPVDTAGEDSNIPDASSSDLRTPDANIDDANIADANVADSNVADSNVADSNIADANIADTNVADSNVADSNIADTNVADSNVADSNIADTNIADTNVLVTDGGLCQRTYVFSGPAQTDDTEISYSVSGPQQLWNNGARPELRVSKTEYPDYRIARSLIRFSLEQLPVSATVVSASLDLGINYLCFTPNTNKPWVACDASETRTLSIALVGENWGEGSGHRTRSKLGVATWLNPTNNGTAWSNSPGNPQALNTTLALSKADEGTVVTSDVTALVREIVENGVANNGFVLYGLDGVSNGWHEAVSIASSEDPTRPPVLTVEVNEACGSGSGDDGGAIDSGGPESGSVDSGAVACTSGRKGYTWHPGSPGSTVAWHTHVVRGGRDCRPTGGGCVVDTNGPYSGDTPCGESWPLLCFKSSGFALPPDHGGGWEQGTFWKGGEFAITEPVQGCSLTSLSAANQLCATRFGTGFVMAEHATLSWDGFAYGAFDGLSNADHMWVSVNDQNSQCWE